VLYLHALYNTGAVTATVKMTAALEDKLMHMHDGAMFIQFAQCPDKSHSLFAARASGVH
jgi:hypothetical protein